MLHLRDLHFEIQGILKKLREAIVGWAEMKCREGIFPQVHTRILFPSKGKPLLYQTTRLFASFYK